MEWGIRVRKDTAQIAKVNLPAKSTRHEIATVWGKNSKPTSRMSVKAIETTSLVVSRVRFSDSLQPIGQVETPDSATHGLMQ